MARSAAEVDASAHAAAQALLRWLEDEHLVMRLVDSYVTGFDRGAPEAFRQRLAALSREVLLFTAAELVEAAVGCFVWLRLGPMRWRDTRRQARFEESFYSALAGELELGAEPHTAFEAQAAAYRALPAAPARVEHFAHCCARWLEPVEELQANASHAAEGFAPGLTKVAQDVCLQALTFCD